MGGRKRANALGAATALSLLGFVVLVLFVLFHDRSWSEVSGGVLAVALLLELVAAALALVTTIAYVVLAARRPGSSTAGKAVWIVLLFLTGPLAGAAYWWRHLAAENRR